VDAGYDENDVVTRHYDPLVAKMIARGGDARIAIGMLANALARTELLGVRTNLPFLGALLRNVDVREHRGDTELVERELAALVGDRPAAPDEAFAIAAAALVSERASRDDPWRSLGPWRVGEGFGTTVVLRERARERAVRLLGSGPFRDGRRVIARDEAHHAWKIGDGTRAAATSAGDTVWVALDGATWELDAAPSKRSVEGIAGAEVAAPMPGVVIAAPARPEQRVQRGDLLFVVEAMKMELRVEAPADGVVKRVLAAVGQQVERGQRLADFEANAG
jgi:acetyl/propionyl-CoA carboxylase alpha subunit